MTNHHAGDLGMVVKHVDYDNFEEALNFLKVKFDLLQDESIVHNGRTVTVQTRKIENWTPEVETIYMLIVAAQAYKMAYGMKQKTLFDMEAL